MRMRCRGFCLLTTLLLSTTSADAASLQVAPVRLQVPPGAAATKIMLRNVGAEPINAQARIFRWTLSKGKEKLVETRDVVASPPIVKLTPGLETIVRIVRTSKQPFVGEEAYRLIVDEIPPAPDKSGLSISFVLRQSIPVFFNGAPGSRANLNWSVVNHAGKVTVTAVNTGDRHARISSLKLTSDAGRSFSFGEGLTGYVLGHSTAQFAMRGKLKGVGPGSKILVTAQGNDGPIEAAAGMGAAN
jgi:fimbrial chaperone protein